MENISEAMPTVKTTQAKDRFFIYVSVILSIFLIVAIAAIIYLLMQNKILADKIAVPSDTNQASAGFSQIIPTGTMAPTPPKGNTRTSIDSVWDLYTNNTLGFSIKIPKNFYHASGACQWNDAEKSYRPKVGLVPSSVFELPDSVYISSKDFYELGGETNKDGVSYFSQCTKVENTLAKLQDKNYFQEQDWKIIRGNILSEEGLVGFIKDNYGQTCKVGAKKPTSQPDVFDVSIDMGGAGPGAPEANGCFINYAYAIKYSPSRKKAFTWVLGQATQFAKSATWDSYDTEMADSFKFTD